MASCQSQVLIWASDISPNPMQKQQKKLSLSTDTSLPSTYNFLSKRNVQIPHVPCNQNSTLLFILPQITLKPRDEHGSSWARQSNPSALITSHHSSHPGLELERCCCHFLPCFYSYLFWPDLCFTTGQQITLKNISADTSGFYICTSTNIVGTEFCNMTVSVMPRKRWGCPGEEKYQREHLSSESKH